MLAKIKNYVPLNFDLLSNPYNWLFVALVVALGTAAVAAIMSQTSGSLAQDE